MIKKIKDRLKRAKTKSNQNGVQKRRVNDLRKSIPSNRVKSLDQAVNKIVKEYGETLKMLKNT